MKSIQGEDIFGMCCKDYMAGNRKAKITVMSDIAETDYLPADYLFRNFEDMPPHEQKALQQARGEILDIGACAGSHSLYLQDVITSYSIHYTKLYEIKRVRAGACSYVKNLASGLL